MGKVTKSENVVAKILTYILVVLLVLGIVGVIVYLLAKNEGVTFSVEYGGERYVANGDGGSLELLNGKTHSFAVESLIGGEVDYSVTVTANSANNFVFTIDGKYRQFYSTTAENNDYSEVFVLEKKTDGFSLTFPDHFTVEQAVEAKHGGDIELQDELRDDLCYFVVTVTSDESTVKLWFTFSDLTVTLNPPQIVF